MKRKLNFDKLKTNLFYIFAGAVILLAAFFGSLDKSNAKSTLSLTNFANQNYEVSTDQITELYMVAELSSSIGLASATDVASNYVTTITMHNMGQNSTGKLQKTPVIDTSEFQHGVIAHIVTQGETMEMIAKEYGLTTDQIRWSNGLKTTTSMNVGDTLYLPNVPGIIYTVKSGDTIENIASKYGSNVEEITERNDLKLSNGLTVGARLIIANGTLPEKERPEYVAPVYYPTSTYTYLGSYSSRKNIRVIAYNFWENSPGNPGYAGQCTWYAWWWRATNPASLGKLAGGTTGNASNWANYYAYRGVGKKPVVGAVFQYGGGVGHVGVVTAVHSDGSITIREMNYGYYAYRVLESEVPASVANTFNYIY